MKPSRGMILSITLAAAILLVAQTEVNAAEGDTLAVEDGFGLPGSDNNVVTVMLDNVTAIKGLYFIVKDVPKVLTITGASLNPAFAANFRMNFKDQGDSARVLVMPAVTPTPLIQPGSAPILSLLTKVHQGTAFGTTVSLSITREQVADEFNNPVSVSRKNGTFWIGLKGDVDGSGEIDLFDVIRMIDIALQRQPAPSVYEAWAGDFDNDGNITVIDIGIAIDKALGNSLLCSGNAAHKEIESAGLVSLALSSPRTMPDGKIEVPVIMRSSSSLAGVQMSMTFDAESYQVDLPKTAEMSAHMKLSTRVAGNEIRMIVFSPDGYSIPAGDGVLLTIPLMAVSEQKQESMLSLNAAISASEGGYKPETFINKDGVTSHTVPKSFALLPNSPNPFNSGTTITYEIPQLSMGDPSIQLSVYNIHGQLVRTLVDAKRSAGRYSLVWDGRDNYGQAVSTGVYFYKLIAGGSVLNRKMALLR